MDITEASLNEIWNKTINELGGQTSRPTIKTWFSEIRPVSFSDGVLKLNVPNKMVKFWVEQKLHYTLLKAAKSFIPELEKIDYVLIEERLKTTTKISQSQKTFSYYKKTSLFEADPSTNLNHRYRFDNFVVGGNNELAFAAAQGIVNDSSAKVNPLFIYGGVGLGKTHLLQSIGNEILKNHKDKKVKYITSEQFTNELIDSLKNNSIDEFKLKFRGLDFLIVDDTQFFSGKTKSQEELFHTFNFIYNASKQIIFSSDRPPALIPDIEQRLRSRFEGGLIIDITTPDLETRLAILKIKCQEKGFLLDNEILELIAKKINRNIRELEGALNLVVYVIKEKKIETITEERINEILKDYLTQLYRKITPQKIIKIVSDFYNIQETDMLKKSRKVNIIKPRQVVMYLLRDLGKMSYVSIGEVLSNRDHTTIIYSCEKIVKELNTNIELSQEVEILRTKILEL